MEAGASIVVVGAGAAAVLLVEALRHQRPLDDVVVVGCPHRPGRGVAYSTTDARHRMNVPARRLGVDDDGTDHLSRWLVARGGDGDPEAFVERRVYGDYLAEQLDAAGVRGVEGRVVTARTVAGDADRPWQLGLDDGRTLRADRVVLAVGPPAGPGPVALPHHPRVLANPWDPTLATLAADAGTVAIVGAGLTMVDVALTAAAAGARVVSISRHGEMPEAHPRQRRTAHLPIDPPPDPLTAALVRRLVVDACRAEPTGWEAALDLLRERADGLWAALPEAEQAKLLRRGLSEWTRHRHRMAPEVGAAVAGLLDDGTLTLERGTAVEVTADGVGATVIGRDGRTWRAGLVVSCTGPSTDITRTTDPLVRDLLDTGGAEVGPHRLGLAVDADGRVLGTAPGLYALGPLRKGTNFETTAIPEIRTQARALARLLGAATPVSPPRPSRPGPSGG